MNKVKLSIIIVNYNTSELLNSCVKSVLKYTNDINYEIIIVDNASKEPKSKIILSELEKDEKIEVVLNRKNYGFAKGNNIGIEKSAGDYILLLNSDTRIEMDIFKEFIQWMDNHPSVGIASCVLKNQDKTLQGNGGYFPNLFRIWAWMLFVDDLPFVNQFIKPFHPWPRESKSGEVDWVTGAFFLIRKKVIDSIGLLDEDYFMYVEDMDYCFRAKHSNWKVYLKRNLSIVHLGGKSSTRDYPIISEFKSIKLFYKKHMPSWQSWFLTPAFKTGCILRMFIFGIFKGPQYAQIYEKAFTQI